jgi:hypothetical protein
MVGNAQSTIIDASFPIDTWTWLSASGTAPAGTVVAQAVLTFFQCDGVAAECWDGVGSVYYDDVLFYEN